jgi:hypothetical protein
MLELKDDNGLPLPQEVQDRVNNFIDKLPTVPWFKPSKDLKKEEVEKQALFTLECFGIKASIEYRILTSEKEWDSANASARARAISSEWASARATAIARAMAWSIAWASANEWVSASVSTSEWDSANALREVLLEDNEDFNKQYPN